ncbi:MAG: DMT family transporter [Candidatus Rokubacteria bacterium]|nr:DMT family transporter [Candidatus Rokubacteria bacterium]
MLATVVLAWGLTWPVNKVLLEAIPPLWMAAIRSAVGAAALVLAAIVRGGFTLPQRGDLPVMLSITLLHMVGFVVLANIGLQLVPTGRSVVLAYTTPLWVAPGAWLFLGEPLTRRRIGGVVIGLLGLVVLFNPLAFDWTDRAAVLGNLAILGAAFLWAASILHVRGHRWRGTPFDLVPSEMVLATAVLVPVAFVSGEWPAIEWDARLVMLLVYSAIPGTVIAYWAVAMAGRLLPAVTTSLGLLATPVVSIVVAALWLGEAPTPALLAGIALILSGVALGTTGARARR